MEAMDDAADESAAMAAADQLLDASYWLTLGQEALQDNRPQDALEACRRTLLLLPDMAQLYALMLEAGDRVGDGSSAAMALSHLVRLRPDEAALHLRYAEGLLASGEIDRSVLHLKMAVRQEPGAVWPYVTALAKAGRYTELLACQPLLDALAHPPPVPFGPYSHLALAKLATGLDRADIQRTIVGLERSAAWLQPNRLLERLQQAIDAGQPFSAMRLDEAESRFLCYASPRAHLLLRSHEATTMADTSWHAWTGEIIASIGETRIALLGRDVLHAVDQANILCIADAEVMALDNYHFSFLAEVQRLVLRNDGRHYASSRVLPMLHELYPFFRPLLADQPFLGVVSPYPELAARLGRFAGIVETISYIVPETGAPAAGYFPDGHQQSLESLVVPFPGAIFLVSAGILGKLWCARIKTLGGIAIEIGELARRWVKQ